MHNNECKESSTTLSNDDGSENVAKKWICVLSNLLASICDPFNLSNEGNFSWSGLFKDLIQVQKKKGKFVVVYLRPP